MDLSACFCGCWDASSVLRPVLENLKLFVENFFETKRDSSLTSWESRNHL